MYGTVIPEDCASIPLKDQIVPRRMPEELKVAICWCAASDEAPECKKYYTPIKWQTERGPHPAFCTLRCQQVFTDNLDNHACHPGDVPVFYVRRTDPENSFRNPPKWTAMFFRHQRADPNEKTMELETNELTHQGMRKGAGKAM